MNLAWWFLCSFGLVSSVLLPTIGSRFDNSCCQCLQTSACILVALTPKQIRVSAIHQKRLDPITALTIYPPESLSQLAQVSACPLKLLWLSLSLIEDGKPLQKAKREAARWIDSDGWLACWSTTVTTKPYVQTDKGVFFFGRLCRWGCALAGTRKHVCCFAADQPTKIERACKDNKASRTNQTFACSWIAH